MRRSVKGGGEKGGKWDNGNSIINKNIFKKRIFWFRGIKIILDFYKGAFHKDD